MLLFWVGCMYHSLTRLSCLECSGVWHFSADVHTFRSVVVANYFLTFQSNRQRGSEAAAALKKSTSLDTSAHTDLLHGPAALHAASQHARMGRVVSAAVTASKPSPAPTTSPGTWEQDNLACVYA